jgi:hypothetical protein
VTSKRLRSGFLGLVGATARWRWRCQSADPVRSPAGSVTACSASRRCLHANCNTHDPASRWRPLSPTKRPLQWWPGAKSDPYAVVNIGISAAATRVVQQNLEPTWEETFFLFVSDPSKQRLAVRVLDADVGKADDLLGTAQRGLQDLADGQTHELELALRWGTPAPACPATLPLPRCLVLGRKEGGRPACGGKGPRAEVWLRSHRSAQPASFATCCLCLSLGCPRHALRLPRAGAPRGPPAPSTCARASCPLKPTAHWRSGRRRAAWGAPCWAPPPRPS